MSRTFALNFLDKAISGEDMGVVLTGNRLLYYLLIVFTGKCNGLPSSYSIDHVVLLRLEKLEWHQNNDNASGIVYRW